MESKESNRNQILSFIGLKDKMVENDTGTPFNRTKFHRYVPRDYPGSERKETDEVYRMGEVVLLHKDSGLRALYLTSESYYGDEYSYSLMGLFIVTKEGKSSAVIAADFNARRFETDNGVIPFEEVIKEIE